MLFLYAFSIKIQNKIEIPITTPSCSNTKTFLVFKYVELAVSFSNLSLYFYVKLYALGLVGPNLKKMNISFNYYLRVKVLGNSWIFFKVPRKEGFS